MGELFGSIWWLIVSLGVLVTFHEFGHYWVARRCGVRVLRFSVGFGKPLWKRVGRDGVEWVVAAIPLGGYVKMLDEREADVPASQLHEAFNRKPVGQRIAIVAAGPLFNLVLTVLLLWLVFMMGRADFLPLMGKPAGIAAEAGLRDGDRVLAIDGQSIQTWMHAEIELTAAGLDRRPVDVEVADTTGASRHVTLDLSRLGESFNERDPLGGIGIRVRQLQLPPVLGEVSPGSAAADAGLQPGDRIVAIDGVTMEYFSDIGTVVRTYREGAPPLQLQVQRGAEQRTAEMQPRWTTDRGQSYWALGVGAPRVTVEYDTVLQYGPLGAVGASLRETHRLTGAIVGMVWRMVKRVASLDNVSGPLTIAQVANATASRGVTVFLTFLAMMSLSLFVMNLLPIPILDGGHLLYYFIEMIKGSPVSERALIAGQYVGLVFLVGLMGLAFYNDISGLVARLTQ